jgi:predicted porin
MKFKTTAIAMAVAGVVAAPMAAQADIGAYASGRIGLQVISTDNVDPASTARHPNDGISIKSHGSRFGIKGENDMGNGMTSFGHYELGIAQDGLSTRNLHVGLRGDFGEVKLGGKTYSAFYNHVTGPVDQPWWENGIGFLSTGRTGNVINYEGGSGAFGFGVAYSADGSVDASGSDNGQGYQVAGHFDIGPVTLGLGITSSDAQDVAGGGGDIVGGTISGDAGSVYYALTYQTNDDKDAIEGYIGIAGFYLNYGQTETTASGVTPNKVTLGYTQSIGRGTSAWYEYATYDADTGNSADDYDVFHAVLKVDWK